MKPIVEILIIALNLYWWVVILSVIFSWLYAFNVVNSRNQFVSMAGDFLYRATEPVFSRIRRFVPAMGGLDLSPIIVILLIYLIQRYLALYVLPAVP